ncbi:DUF3667 domain-containing protein [Aurantibacter sp.]|uniref:DUF3667 domain-containing protein n=1 Tax=Aurantibacter sp. TaxID=2807103 RepID=UPI0035C832D7
MAYHSCKNCNHPFGVAYKYCPNCGLKQVDKLSVKSLFNNTIQNYFAFDARFFKSIIPLLFKPGFLPKQFVKGKRLTYLHPAQLYLFSTILFFFIFSFLASVDADEMDATINKAFKTASKREDELKVKSIVNDSVKIHNISEDNKQNVLNQSNLSNSINDNDDILKINTDGINFFKNKQALDSLIALNAPEKSIYKEMGMNEDASYFKRKLYKQFFKLYKKHNLGSLYKHFIGSVPIALFFLLPIFALLLRLFYYSSKVFVNHLVFSFYYFSFAFFLFSINLVISYIVDLGIYNVILFICLVTYLIIAIKNYYNKKWIGTFFKTIALLLSYWLFIIPLAIAVTLVISFMFY